MKRARIKAMVTVPARRKATQDSTPVESNNIPENDDKTQVTSDTSVTPPEPEPVQPVETQNLTQNSSPTKVTQNRSCFMRPTPRLDTGGRVRRNSIRGSGASASESEDDTRRVTCTTSNRERNDSICSVQSTNDTTANNSQNNLPKCKAGPKRRMLVSESARKLAETRREFFLKHENKTPDRSKLTMYDLIYYNPITNPMKRPKELEAAPRKISVCQPDEAQEEEDEEDIDDPMPVPQVKVGPDGQLIIDEQSLVIEQTNAKKSREVLSKEAIIDDDNNGSGFYKRRQKSKEWPKWETLKFYQALNTVGTDFLLMKSLFPNRTRQEIKLKFKKEEKVNRNLVEKALAYHQEFDTEILEKSLAKFEESGQDHSTTQVKQKNSDGNGKKKIKSERKRKSRIVASSIAEMDASEEEGEPNLNNLVKQKNDAETNNNHCQQAAKRRKHFRSLKEEKEPAEGSQVEADDLESLSSRNDSDSDTEIYHVRPTRSGRLPKIKKLQGPDINTLDNVTSDHSSIDPDVVPSLEDNERIANDSNMSDNVEINTANHCTDTIKRVIPDIGKVEPGSLVILTKESSEEPGKSVLQVYMVSSNVNSSEDQEKPSITPVDLSPELLATVTTSLSDIEPIDVKKECE